jgi:NADH-quinone oxidoreductase subunit A
MLRPRSTPPGSEGPEVTDFYRQYLTIAVLIGAALAMFGGMLTLSRVIRPNRPQPDKFVTYEAGSDPVGGWGQSNLRYYVYALLFVIFDVEAVFVFPWAVRLESLGTFGIIEMAVFILLLALGLVYAWRKGVLRWA